MSRITYNEWDSAEGQWAGIRWGGAAKKAINGKRGQAALRELKAALLVLPSKRLIADRWAASGDVCALGALDVHRMMARTGMNWDAARLVVQQTTQIEWIDYWGDPHEDDESSSAELGQSRLGLTYTLAWEIIEKNDEYRTPEDRYTRMLGWLNSNIDAVIGGRA